VEGYVAGFTDPDGRVDGVAGGCPGSVSPATTEVARGDGRRWGTTEPSLDHKSVRQRCPAARFQLGNEGRFLPHPLGELKSPAREYLYR